MDKMILDKSRDMFKEILNHKGLPVELSVSSHRTQGHLIQTNFCKLKSSVFIMLLMTSPFSWGNKRSLSHDIQESNFQTQKQEANRRKDRENLPLKGTRSKLNKQNAVKH